MDERQKQYLLLGFIYIFLVAFIMTLFELIFFLVIVVPQQERNIRKYIDDIDAGNGIILNSGQSQDELLDQNIFIDRENKIIDRTKESSIAFIGIEAALLIIIAFILTYLSRANIHDKSATYISAFLTVCILISFQIVMYYFAKKYKYVTTNEIKAELYKYLKENL